MSLSKLQHYIMEECVARGGSISRRILDANYKASQSRARGENFKKIITQSIERLIGRGLVVGYGMKTKEKLFIDRVRLTSGGRQRLETLRRRAQPRLPIK